MVGWGRVEDAPRPNAPLRWTRGLADAGVKTGRVGYQGSWDKLEEDKLPKGPGEGEA